MMNLVYDQMDDVVTHKKESEKGMSVYTSFFQIKPLKVSESWCVFDLFM